MSSIGSSGLESILLGYYQSQLASMPSSLAAANAVNTAASQQNNPNSATADDIPPWTQAQPTKTALQAKLLSTTNFLDTSNVPLSAGSGSDTKTEQDNQKLFSLYTAVNSLSQLAQMAQSSTATSGQLAGLNTRFQTGLSQIEDYINSTNFNNFTLQAATPSASVTSTAKVAIADLTYKTQQFVADANLSNPLPGLSASDSFTINIKKGATTTPVNIDLSQVQGGLTLKNIVTYINTTLSAAGFATRFQVNQKGGTSTSTKGATYGLQITPGGVENVSLSATSKPALYLVGNSGSATEVDTKVGSGNSATIQATPANQAGRITKIGLNGAPTTINSETQDASSGVTTAQATVVDGSGNVYVLGNATGDFGSQLNQGTQDVYITKYDSAGNVVWQNLVGSAGSASGYGLALDPAGGVVIAGTSTADMTATSIGDGNNDSFVASYDAKGNQTWVTQIPTLATNQANSVSVDASGNIIIGGSVSGGVIGAGQIRQGTTGSDAYLVQLSSKGKILAENQFGTTGVDQVSATAIGSDGSLYVASVQNGEAIISKYASSDITAAPVWSQDIGALQPGGSIGGLAVSGNQLYLSGTTNNANLTGGGASIAAASNGGKEAFVFKLTDNGASVSSNQVSYVGTAATDQGGAVTVASDGTVYLAGTTSGTFAGQNRSVQNVNNAFVAALNSNGSVAWTQQYGGASGQSTGAAVAVDPNGASVLDALGLPSGTVNVNQSVTLGSQTTLRAGDTLQMKIEGVAPRTFTITIDKGETFDSLVTKLNGQLGSAGKATVNYTGGSQNLKITASDGKTIDLIAGPKDTDALGRLGIAPGVLSAPAANSNSSSSAASSGTNPTYGLGLTGGLASITGGSLNVATKTGADLARSQLLTVLSNIQSIYQKSNAPPPGPNMPGDTTSAASSATTSQLASYGTALSLLGTSSSSAMSNIQMIVAGYDPNSASASTSTSGGLLGLF